MSIIHRETTTCAGCCQTRETIRIETTAKPTYLHLCATCVAAVEGAGMLDRFAKLMDKYEDGGQYRGTLSERRRSEY